MFYFFFHFFYSYTHITISIVFINVLTVTFHIYHLIVWSWSLAELDIEDDDLLIYLFITVVNFVCRTIMLSCQRTYQHKSSHLVASHTIHNTHNAIVNIIMAWCYAFTALKMLLGFESCKERKQKWADENKTLFQTSKKHALAVLDRERFIPKSITEEVYCSEWGLSGTRPHKTHFTHL